MAPSTTSATTMQRAPSLNRSKGQQRDRSTEPRQSTEKFPDFESTEFQATHTPKNLNGRRSSLYNHAVGASNDRWTPRRDSSVRAVRFANLDQPVSQPRRHARQQSIGDAFRNIRTRSGSVTQNAQELAEALRAPVSPRLITLCILWYASSALTNTSAKSILNAYNKPATLTLIQFGFVSLFCLLSASLASASPAIRNAVPALRHGIRYPNAQVVRATLPLAAFQIGGHLLSSNATAKIPVSLVHTIKGLSPLFTVFAYRFIFDIRYPTATYISLIPLTLGVMLACSGKQNFGGQLVGIIYSLLATLIFVTQNIFSKRLFNEAARSEAEGGVAASKKLDKLNLLCYSSGLAFVLTAPIWLWTEGFGIIGDLLHDGTLDLVEGPDTFDHGRLLVEFIFNGVFHFGQNILAFVLLSLVSPVTYSVASLIKRVFVIVIALLWFRSPTTSIQAAGIALTFLGLYLYDRSNESNKADRKARTMTEAKTAGGKETPLLPLTTSGLGMNGSRLANSVVFDSPAVLSGVSNTNEFTYAQNQNNNNNSHGEDSKKSDDAPGIGRARNNSSAAGWRPPGTRQEDTWRLGDQPTVVA